MKTMMVFQILLFAFTGTNLLSCGQKTSEPTIQAEPAVVQNVKVSGQENAYTFAVTLKSPDTGCNQYANWWEVISADGKNLLYRRILGHSHVDEQPFTRSGGPVNITAETDVIIRAHMDPSGYGDGPITMKGSVAKGFSHFTVEANFSTALEDAAPQPTGCAF